MPWPLEMGFTFFRVLQKTFFGFIFRFIFLIQKFFMLAYKKILIQLFLDYCILFSFQQVAITIYLKSLIDREKRNYIVIVLK